MGEKLNKKELVPLIRDKLKEISGNDKVTKDDAEMALDSVFEVIKKSLLRGDKVGIWGFGTFEIRKRKARLDHDFGNGIKVDIPEQYGVKCNFSDKFKKELNEKLKI
ncbi:HU family DNA-binding protein [Chengkuizengella marina]|uniref:HU family DNA-binding protein n=1 Tax=Chengkuizengella marina TaxID=2507566 RepID=A0A6N9PYL5_9BACL|nr:HU family DNA-binding protein [Chengkuizengella marina]NBI28611.1 HU family DNA-binding protein [Chengkuizengella marina]